MSNRLPATVTGLFLLSIFLGVVFARNSPTVQKAPETVVFDTPYEVTPVQAQRRHFIDEMDAKLGGFRVLADSEKPKLVVNAEKWNTLSPDDQESAATVALAYVNWATDDGEIGEQSIDVFDMQGFHQIGSFDKSGYANL